MSADLVISADSPTARETHGQMDDAVVGGELMGFLGNEGPGWMGGALVSGD